jgi:hypothetical protein
MGNSMNKRSVLKQGRTKLIGMKTKAFLATLLAMIVLSCPVYAANSTVVGPSSTAVIPDTDTRVVTNHVEGKVVKWSPPHLTVQGDIYYEEASGEPAVVIRAGTKKFLITENTRFPIGKKEHLKDGLHVKVLFHDRGSGTKEAASVLFGHASDSSSIDSDNIEAIPGSTKIFDNFNGERVVNGPQRTSVFSISKPTVITSIRNYHWNNGHGGALGEIWLVDQQGRKYGPWRASGVPGSGVVQNAYWVVSPNVKIGAGTYTIHDSDPATWSHNSRSQNAGMSQVDGYYKTKTTPDTVTTDHPKDTTTTTTTKTTPDTTTQNQGRGWYLVGSPEIYKNPFNKEDCSYFGFRLTVSDGSAVGSRSWKDCSNQTKCSGTYTGSATWTKPPAYMEPGSKISFAGNARTTANNTCGYRNMSSAVTVKINGGILLEVIESRSPSGSAVYTVPKGSPGSKLVIEVSPQTASLYARVTYTYVYK